MALFLIFLSFFLSWGFWTPTPAASSPKNLFLLKIENRVPGLVAVSMDQGTTWRAIGSVKKFATEISDKGFTAASWIGDMRVAATAVNAIHLKVGEDTKTERARLISIVPDLDKKIEGSYFASTSTVMTNIRPGDGCFGGAWTPFVGNTFEAKWVEGRGEEWIIAVHMPTDQVHSITFENRFDGDIVMRTRSGERRIVGRVLRPVLGVGRFVGTVYVGPGRIRANHPGVIDISTSPVGKIGGFQIIPAEHGMSPEMGRARAKTQWMVVGGAHPDRTEPKGLEGQAPLFQGFLRPLFDDEKLLERFLVDVQLAENGPFVPIPIHYLHPDLKRPLPEWANGALKNVRQIRILFPFGDGPQDL